MQLHDGEVVLECRKSEYEDSRLGRNICKEANKEANKSGRKYK